MALTVVAGGGLPEYYGVQSPPVVAGRYLYFALQNGLWRVDALGVVAHVWSGSYVGNLTAVGGELYFVSSQGDQSVYRTNGKVGGTVRLEPDGINLYTNPYELTPVQTPAGTRVFFRAYGFGPGGSAQGTGQELWATDGTVEGTRLVRDVNAHESLEYPGYPGSSLPLQLTAAGSALYFTAWEPEHGRELWKSDGTAEGTVLVKDITDDTGTAQSFERSGEMSFRELLPIGGKLLFTTWSPESGVELWATDGTSEGTAVVRDIVPGDGSSYPTELTADGSTAFFSAWDPENGRELWQTDGTEAGTVRVADIAPGSASSSPSQLSLTDGSLFCSATVDAVGRELWRMPIPRVRIEPVPVVPEGGTASLLASGTDPDGNGLTFDWDMDGDGTYELTGLGSPSATFSAAAIDGPSSRVVRVRATDATGVAAIDEATVLVINVAPTVEAGPAVTLDPGQALARPGTFSDPGLDSWTATVDYGDGPGPQPLPLSGKAFTLAHAYASPGTYTLRVTVLDDDGGTGTATVTVDGRALPRTRSGRSSRRIEGLIDDGTLKLGQGKSLVGKLELALYMLEWGNTKKAITMLEAFIHEVRAFKNAGILEPGQADEMIRVAEAAIASLAG